MNTTPYLSIAFDMDGVIFRTTLPKHDAMLNLFPSKCRPALSPVVLSLGGVPRRRKLAAVHHTCYGSSASDEQLMDYLSRYEVALAGPLSESSLTPGIRQFLQTVRGLKFICSSAPKEEVASHIERAELSSHFTLVSGAPTTKLEALNIARGISDQRPLVFFGDALADLEAAQAAKVGFVAVVGEVDQFVGVGVPKIDDFSDLHTVQTAIELAMASPLWSHTAK